MLRTALIFRTLAHFTFNEYTMEQLTVVLAQTETLKD